MKRFVHLHVHSEYSLLEGACRIESLVDQASQFGMKALAITDYGTMYGVIPFYKACIKKGIQPIIGVVLDLIYGNLEDRLRGKEEKRYPLILLAENKTGYKNLLSLVTEANQRTAMGRAKVTLELLNQYAGHILAISSGVTGEVQHYLMERNVQEAARVANTLKKIFGEANFFLGLEDQGLEEQRMLNQRILTFSREYQIPLVATNNVHYVKPSEAVIHDILLCIGSGKAISDSDRERYPNDQFYLKSPDEMIKLFPYAPEAVLNTIKIAERCRFELTFGEYILPEYPLPAGETATSYLRKRCEEGLIRRYEHPSKEARERLEYELSVIEKMGFSDYFLIVWDFMRYAHQENIITGPGRGSAAGSLVAYVLQITNVDPLKYKLLFERFLNPERISMPDIDIDFEVERRAEVIQYVTEKYGHDHVAQIITFGTMAARAAIRDVGRVLNYPNSLVDRTAKLIPHGTTLEQAITTIPELKQAYDENDQVEKLVNMARGIEGLPRHASTHAAGIVISKQPLTHYVPLQRGNEGFSLTQYSMEYLEDIGLLKMDFLGLRNLTILDYTLFLIRKNRKADIRLDQIPHDDPKTFELLSKGDATGIFQLESSGMRNCLREVRPNCLEDIIAILAIYRPGPMEIIPKFAAAKNGKEKVVYLHDDLKPVLEDTYGFILYQEQIMQIASKMAGYTLGEADVLRRAVSKKKREILEKEREHFVEGCRRKGYSLSLGHELYDLIVRFADYGFNRSHSAAYSLIAYQMAFLKANYPHEFLTALLGMSVGNPVKIAEYVEEAKRKGIVIVPPDINKSDELFAIHLDQILFGLSAIKNVGIAAVRAIIDERKKRGHYKSLMDFCTRVDLRLCNRRVLEALIQSGAMDSIPGHRTQKLSVLDQALEKGSSIAKDGGIAQGSLFGESDEMSLTHNLPFPDVPPYTSKEMLALEQDLLGLYLSGHPLDEYAHILARKDIVPIHELMEYRNQENVMVVGIIMDVKVITTRKGAPMAFATIEDKIKQVELVVFPTVYDQVAGLLKRERMVIVQGKIDRGDHQIKLIVTKIWDLPTVANQKNENSQATLFIKISDEVERSGKLLLIQKELLNYPGTVPVKLYYESQKVMRELKDKYKIHLNDDLLRKLERIAGSHTVIVKE